jgi:translation elongation factor EF-Ts
MNLEAISENKFKKIVKDAVRDVLEKEMAKLRLLIAPYISDEEQKEIEASYKKPSKRTGKTLLLQE